LVRGRPRRRANLVTMPLGWFAVPDARTAALDARRSRAYR
jgi:hypothetical protein